MQKIKLSIGLAFSLLLCGCQQQPVTHDYLLEHPNVLEKKVAECNNASGDDTKDVCDIVHQAARDFMQLANDRNSDPEKFGKQIIEIETQMAQLKAQPEQQEKYRQLQQQLRIKYAVIAATTTE